MKKARLAQAATAALTAHLTAKAQEPPPEVYDPRWYPQTGPQEEAIAARYVTELFFGGARYGGKSDFLLGDFAADVKEYGAAWRGVLFRKTFPQLEDLIVRSKEIYLRAFPGAWFAEQSKTWHFPNGAYLRMRSLERDALADNFIGHAYCVGEGTPILMGDGSYKPIELVRVGDSVMTLEGAKRVLATMPRRLAECVLASTLFGAQVQPTTHPILLASGKWGSYASLAGGQSADTASFVQPQESGQPGSLCVPVVLYGQPPQSIEFHQQQPTQFSTPDKFHRPFDETCRESLHTTSASKQDRQPSGAQPPLVLGYNASLSVSDGNACAPSDSQTVSDSHVDCPSDSRSRDQQPRFQRESDPGGIPSPGDVGGPSRDDCRQDEGGNTPVHNRKAVSEYVHPYIWQVRPVTEDNFFGTCTLTPVGKRAVFDLTVEDANHYITSSKLVSKNTWIGWDELPTWATHVPYVKLIACLRSGSSEVPVKRIRSTGNPGGVGHLWVKNRFVGSGNAYAYKIRLDDETGFTRLFVPSRVDDNQIGLRNDPGYIARLRAVAGVSEALLKAWLDGDWDVVAGAYFDVWGPQHIRLEHEIRIEPWWPVWIGMDWGFKHNTAVYWLTTDDEGRVGIFDEHVISGQSARELAEQIAARSEGRKVEDFWLSPDAFAKRTDAETIGVQLGDELAQYGLPFPAQASTDRIGGAQLLYRLMKDNQFWVSTRCQGLINVIPAIVHDPDKQEQTLKMDGDDEYDGARYGVYSKLGPRKKSLKQTLMEKVNSPDPTVRNIQALMAQRRLDHETGMQGVRYTPRYNR